MNTILSREQIDSGSNYNFPDKMETVKINSSVFDLSHTITTTIPNGGLIIPLTWFEILPNDNISIDVNHLIRVMPQVVPLMSRQRIFIHAFAMYYGDMQSDFQVLMTKGMNGTKIKKIAPLTTSNIDSTIYDSGNGTVAPESLANYLGLPIGANYADLINSGISALPFFMYEKIYLDYYMNRNYYLDNENYIPDDIEMQRIDENGNIASNTDNLHAKITFGKLHFRDYPYDYLLSSLPFQQRGNAPTINMSITGDLFKLTNAIVDFTFASYQPTNAGLPRVGFPQSIGANPTATPSLQFENVVFPVSGTLGSDTKMSSQSQQFPWDGIDRDDGTFPSIGNDGSNFYNHMKAQQNAMLNKIAQNAIATTINLDTIRQLAREQHELEVMARTDGSYFEMGLSFYGKPPKTAHKCRPILIGTTYNQLSFTEVVQSGATTVNGVLGTLAGHGISISNKGRIGNFNSEDYGMIMIVATIMPDVFYCQNLEKKWFRKYQSEMFLPGREKMGLQPVYNKEAYFSGTKATDDDLFAYQNPFDDLRYIANRVTGKIADPNNASFSPYTQVRFLNTTPTFSQSFAIADDVSKDYLFAPSESAYVGQFKFDIRAVRSLPYKAIPMNFGL